MFMQIQFQLGNYIHACRNETNSLANLQDLIPTLAVLIIDNKNYSRIETLGPHLFTVKLEI